MFRPYLSSAHFKIAYGATMPPKVFSSSMVTTNLVPFSYYYVLDELLRLPLELLDQGQ